MHLENFPDEIDTMSTAFQEISLNFGRQVFPHERKVLH